MQVITVKHGGSLSDLVGQVYQLKDAGGAQARTQAEAALIQANPQLKDLGQVPEGAVILVPEVPGIEIVASPDEPQALHADAFARLSATIGTVQKTLTAAAKADVAMAKATQKLVKSKTFTQQLDSDEAKSALAEVNKNSRARIKAGEALGQTIADTLARAGKDLADLQQRIVPRPPPPPPKETY
jgi:hypothetical protein